MLFIKQLLLWYLRQVNKMIDWVRQQGVMYLGPHERIYNAALRRFTLKRFRGIIQDADFDRTRIPFSVNFSEFLRKWSNSSTQYNTT